MERLWTKFFSEEKNLCCYKNFSNTHEFNRMNSMINISLSSIDKYLDESSGCCHLINHMIDDITSYIDDAYTSEKTFDEAMAIYEGCSEIISKYFKRLCEKKYYSENEAINSITKSLIDQIEYQECPDNRVVTCIACKPIRAESTYYEVYVDSNCNGWAEDTDKFIGYTLNEEIPLKKGITEKELLESEYLDTLTVLAKGILMLNEDNTECYYDPNDDAKYIVYQDKHSFASFLEGLACELLINSDGSCNYYNMHKLSKEYNIDVYAGEKDSFGWLTGCLKNPNGIVLVYG